MKSEAETILAEAVSTLGHGRRWSAFLSLVDDDIHVRVGWLTAKGPDLLTAAQRLLERVKKELGR